MMSTEKALNTVLSTTLPTPSRPPKSALAEVGSGDVGLGLLDDVVVVVELADRAVAAEVLEIAAAAP